MPWEPAAPPLLSDENANELGRWALQQLQQLAAAFENPDITSYNVLHVAPTNPREGQVVVADGSDWNPGSGAGQYMYIGGQWVIRRGGPEPNSYGTITDGTTPASAGSAGDTFKLRGEGITPVTQNNDGTHGDNVNIRLTPTILTLTTPALDDALPFGDVSNSNNPKKMTPQTLLDLINSLATEASPDFAADFLALADASGAVAKKVALANFARPPVLISTTAITATNTINITIPSGYTHVELVTTGMSPANSTQLTIGFSEDAGSTLLSGSVHLFNNGGGNNGTFSAALALLYPSTAIGNNAANTFFSHIRIFDYASANDKFTQEQGLEYNAQNLAWRGNRKITSTAAINQVRYSPASGNFDAAGSILLYGLP